MVFSVYRVGVSGSARDTCVLFEASRDSVVSYFRKVWEARVLSGCTARKLARQYYLISFDGVTRGYWALVASGRGDNAHLKAVYDGAI